MANRKQQQTEWNSQRHTAFAYSILRSEHGNHNIDVQLTNKGPHAGKIVCNSCNKHVAWIPKAVLETL